MKQPLEALKNIDKSLKLYKIMYMHRVSTWAELYAWSDVRRLPKPTFDRL